MSNIRCFFLDPACQNIDTKNRCYTSQSFCHTEVNKTCHACDNNFLIVIIALLCVIAIILSIIISFAYKKKHSENESKLMHEILHVNIIRRIEQS